MQKNDHLISIAKQLSGLQADILASKYDLLDDFLEGGMRWGELSEWGMPWGHGLRDLILLFLVSAQQAATGPCWILWVYGQDDVRINPIAWCARGLQLETVRFVHAKQPVHDIKPVFLSDAFRIIVLDSPTGLNEDECAFIARQARRQRQLIFVLRPYLLSPQRGNVWARTRVNCWHEPIQQRIFAKIVKGRSPRQIAWPQDSLSHLCLTT